MTIDEFVAKLTEHRSVEFEKIHLTVPNQVVAKWVADSLAQVLPPKQQIFYGVPLDSLEYRDHKWHGKLDWILLIHGYLVRLIGELQKAGSERAFVLAYSFYPLSTIQRATVTTDHVETRAGVFFRSIRLTVEFRDDKIEASASLPSDTADALARLSRYLLTP